MTRIATLSSLMGDWQAQLHHRLSVAAEDGASRQTRGKPPPYDWHLVVLVEPYLESILQGRKTIESRFSKRRIAPYGVVQSGDLLALKRSSGPVVGYCSVAHVEFFELNASVIEQIRVRYAQRLCAESSVFWDARAQMRYATLIHLTEVRRIPPWQCPKRDRRSWVVLRRGI
ncbi:MAG: hypothetical protein QOC81_4874 [Thermoanaerobaculia bacterium]|jgi:ASC-1-like (ASCH) protein|nr:hypothetical protein [Thermoanaerobaculia bacterium]